MIELQEAKRQALKKRVEQTRLDSDSDINWDDIGDIAEAGAGGGDKKKTTKVNAASDDIPPEVQEKLLNDYERELITEKLKKASLDVTEDNRTSPGSSQEKGKDVLQCFLYRYITKFMLFVAFQKAPVPMTGKNFPSESDHRRRRAERWNKLVRQT